MALRGILIPLAKITKIQAQAFNRSLIIRKLMGLGGVNMKDYSKVIEMLEKIKCNGLDTNTDYEAVEIINNAVQEIQNLLK